MEVHLAEHGSFDRGSKCTYRQKKCDNSYDWSVFKKDEDIDKKLIPSLARKI